MANLKRIPVSQPLTEGVIQRQHVTRATDGLEYIELRLLEFSGESCYEESLSDLEVCVVVLTGKATVSDQEQTFTDIGTRSTVFEKIPTDSVYLGINQKLSIKVSKAAKVLLCYSPASQPLPTQLIPASSNRIEQRGINSNQRLVHNILDDQSPISNSLIVVEVFTDSGNWSSYPPHKHDQNNLPLESFLEETYYHEINPQQGFVFQRVYTDDRSLDETMAVENENVVLVPKGYHPVAVPDGYDSYYLNIMAGPIKTWKFHNEPAHEWLLNRK